MFYLNIKKNLLLYLMLLRNSIMYMYVSNAITLKNNVKSNYEIW